MATTSVIGYIGTIVYLHWGSIGIMEKKVETTSRGSGFRV